MRQQISVVLALALAVTCVPSFAADPADLALKGPYEVGFTSFVLSDPSRPGDGSVFAERPIPVYVWYPVDPSGVNSTSPEAVYPLDPLYMTSLTSTSGDWEVYGMDMGSERVADLLPHPRFHFFEGDITINREWVEYHVKKCDVVLPLVAIATPATYVKDPLAVFELDFEANLPIVRACVRYHKRVLFPSTSEVYGMSTDAQFHPYESNLILGPIAKPRWIYSCSKQLLDRVIAAYGQQHGLDYTLFRPFNWIGAGLDSLHTPKEGSSRVVTQFLGHIARGEPIKLVDGGRQRRSFTDVTDGIAALMRII